MPPKRNPSQSTSSADSPAANNAELTTADPTNCDLMVAMKAFQSNITAQISSVTDKLTKKIDTLSDNVAKLNLENEKSKNHFNIINIKVADMSNHIVNLEYEINKLKQRELSNDIIIQGLPTQTSHEEVFQSLNLIYNFGLENIKFLFNRIIKSKDSATKAFNYKQIVARLSSSDIKANFMKKLKDTGPPLLSQISKNNSEAKQTININHRLTVSNVITLNHLQKLKKQNKLLFGWYYNLNIYYKIKPDDEPILFKSLDELKI